MININIIKTIVILSSCALSACATLLPAECQTANWKQIGLSDGQNGLTNRISQHHKACAKVSIVPNQRLYESGYQQGQTYYCQPQIIFERAINGGGSYRVCPVEQHAQLRSYYDVPYSYYQARQKRNALLDDLEKYQDYLLDKNLTAQKRDQYIEKIRKLKSEKYEVESAFDDAERRLRNFERQNKL